MDSQTWPPINKFMRCLRLFKDTFIKRNKKCNFILELHPVPATYKDMKSKPSLLKTPDIAEKPPTKLKVKVNELTFFQASEKCSTLILDQDSTHPIITATKALIIVCSFLMWHLMKNMTCRQSMTVSVLAMTYKFVDLIMACLTS